MYIYIYTQFIYTIRAPDWNTEVEAFWTYRHHFGQVISPMETMATYWWFHISGVSIRTLGAVLVK